MVMTHANTQTQVQRSVDSKDKSGQSIARLLGLSVCLSVDHVLESCKNSDRADGRYQPTSTEAGNYTRRCVLNNLIFVQAEYT